MLIKEITIITAHIIYIHIHPTIALYYTLQICYNLLIYRRINIEYY